MLVWLSVWSEVQTVQLISLHTKTLSSLASFKSRLVLPFYYWLSQVVLEQRPLNGCCSCSNQRVINLEWLFAGTKRVVCHTSLLAAKRRGKSFDDSWQIFHTCTTTREARFLLVWICFSFFLIKTFITVLLCWILLSILLILLSHFLFFFPLF